MKTSEIRERLSKISPWPWSSSCKKSGNAYRSVCSGTKRVCTIPAKHWIKGGYDRCDDQANRDAQFIAASPEIIQSLLDRLDGAREVISRAEKFIVNGTELGYIQMPTVEADPANDMLPAIRNWLEESDG